MSNNQLSDEAKHLDETPKEQWARLQRDSQQLERDFQENIQRLEKMTEYLKSDPLGVKYYLGQVVGRMRQEFPIKDPIDWAFFCGDIRCELNAAKSQLSEQDKTSADYFNKLYEKVCVAGSKAKQYVDFVMQFGITFEDWYHLWELELNTRARCPHPKMPLEDLILTSKQHLDQGVISTEQHRAVVNLIDVYKAKGYKRVFLA